MANLHLKTMMWIFFLPIFEAHLFLKNEMKPPAALKLQINHRGLAYVKDMAMQMLLSQLMEEQIQDQSNSYNVPLLGEISLSFSNIQIEHVQVMDSVAYFVKGTGVSVVIRDVQIVLSSNWKIKSSLGQNNVMVQADINGLSLSVLLGLDVDDGRRALLQHISCSAKVADIDLKFSGPRSSLYTWIIQAIKRTLISDISQEPPPATLSGCVPGEDGQMQAGSEGSDFTVCTEVKKYVDHFSQHLRNTEPWAQIDSEAGIDFALVSKPEITPGQVNLDFKGEFFSVHQRQRSPLLPTPVLLPDRSPSMFVIGASDFLLNSAAFVYFTRNTLRVKYTDQTVRLLRGFSWLEGGKHFFFPRRQLAFLDCSLKTFRFSSQKLPQVLTGWWGKGRIYTPCRQLIPKAVPFRLNTQNVGSLLPELKRQFPGRPMELHLEARKEPKLHFHPGGLDATILGRAKALVVLPNSSLVPVFALHVDCDVTGQISLEAVRSGDSLAKVKGSVALKGLRLSQEWSRIGEIKVSPLETLLKIAGHVALSGLNKKLQKGKLLPSLYGASLVDPEVAMHEGYMLIKTDMHLPLPNTDLWVVGRADGVKEG
ncbi:bactericidal permeability-increasing protein-like [Vipera latastei]